MKIIVTLFVFLLPLAANAQNLLIQQLERQPATQLDISLLRINSFGTALFISTLDKPEEDQGYFKAYKNRSKKITIEIGVKTRIEDMTQENCQEQAQGMASKLSPERLTRIAFPYHSIEKQKNLENLFVYIVSMSLIGNKDVSIECIANA